MISEVLKKSILLFAYQGKLTKNCTAENIEKYYEEIFRENKRPEYNVDDYLYELPATWKIVKFNDVVELCTGNSIPENIKKSKYLNLNDGYNYIGTKDVNFDNSINYNNGVKIPYSEMRFKHADVGDILLCIEGGSVGRKVSLLKEKVCFGNKLCKFHTDLINSEFLFYFLQSPIFLNNFKDNISGLIGGVGTTKIKKMYIPLPDIEEQNEIVRVIKEFETLLIDIKYAEEKLDALKSSFPANMRKSIIHFALQGKMNDRYYSENVDDIILSCCNKKQKLINDKMIKEDKEIEELKPDEIPYEIPSNWRWIRFGKVIKLLSGQDLTSDKYFSSEKENAIPYLTGASNIENGKIIINRWTDSPTSIACKGNILLTCKGTIGTTCVLDIEKVHIARQIMAIDCFDIDTKYVLYFIENFVFKLQSKAKSMIPGIDRNTVLNLPFALPPLHEQREIVKKIDEIIPLLNIIENTLKNKETKK